MSGMTYSHDWLQSRVAAGDHPKLLFFWGHQASKSGQLTAACFSQWWPAPFVVDGVSYATSEHWMMARKARLFADDATFDKIIAASSPGAAKALGREVSNFDQSVWEAQRFEVVLQGCLHKFGQDAALRDYLLKTQDRVLVEASPVDPIWGIGLAATNPDAEHPALWQGLNLLGFALMEARDQLRG